MANFNNVPQEELIEKTAEKLREMRELMPPEWAYYVKTGTHRQRPPMRKEWWYIRAAAVLRTLALKGPIGVSKLRTKYGGKKRRGHTPPEFRKGSGNIIRKILQQLEKAGLAKYNDKGVYKGRIITTKATRLLNECAKELFAKYPKHVAEPTPSGESEELIESLEQPKEMLKEIKEQQQKSVKETKEIKVAHGEAKEAQREAKEGQREAKEGQRETKEAQREAKEGQREAKKVKEEKQKEKTEQKKEEITPQKSQ